LQLAVHLQNLSSASLGALALSDSAAVEVSGVGTVLSGSVGQILYAGEGFSWLGENTYSHRVKSLGV
jgi:hypothetical protein